MFLIWMYITGRHRKTYRLRSTVIGLAKTNQLCNSILALWRAQSVFPVFILNQSQANFILENRQYLIYSITGEPTMTPIMSIWNMMQQHIRALLKK